MKKRDILIVIAVIAFGVIYNAIRSGDIDIKFHRSIYDKPWELIDRSYPRDFLPEEIHFARADKLEIRCPAGDIEVERAAAVSNDENFPQIRIQPSIRIYHKNKDKAEALRQQMKIVAAAETESLEPGKTENPAIQPLPKKEVRIEIKPGEDFPLQRARVNFKVTIPETVELNLRTRYGDIAIDGGGKKITLDSKHGDISVKHVDAELTIDHRNGRVTLSEINGKIDLSANYSRVKINNVSALKLNCSKSNVLINGVENRTHVEYAAYSSIAMEESGGLDFAGRQTKITLKKIHQRIHINNAHQPIYMSEISGDIFIEANNCRIDLEQIRSGEVVIKNAYNDVAVDRISARSLDLLLNNGDLDLAFAQITGKINIKNQHSKVTLIVPAEAQPLFHIQALYGSIVNRASTPLTVIKARERVLANSNDPEGSPEIAISTTYGDILLENRDRKRR
jgi:DUF4097 and DUF4098 domain-containing protein YvlB